MTYSRKRDLYMYTMQEAFIETIFSRLTIKYLGPFFHVPYIHPLCQVILLKDMVR